MRCEYIFLFNCFQNNTNPNGNSLGVGNGSLSSMMASLTNQAGGATPIVLKDRLLTDSVVFSEDFPSMNNTENIMAASSSSTAR